MNRQKIFFVGILLIASLIPFHGRVRADDTVTTIDAVPGIEFTKITSEKKQGAAGSDQNLTTIFGQAFSSAAHAILEFGTCPGGICAGVPNLSAFAKQQEELWNTGYLLPLSKKEQLKWPDQPTDEPRYQWVSNYCAKDKPTELAGAILRAVVNPLMSATKNPQWDLTKIATGERINCAISGSCDPVIGMEFHTPQKNFFESVGGVLKLKQEFYGLFQDCDKNSEAAPVPAKQEPVEGSLGGGAPIDVNASAGEAIDYASRYAGGLAYCILHIPECLGKSLSSTLGFEFASASPLHPIMANYIQGRYEDNELPSDLDPASRTNLTKDKRGGTSGTTLPQSLLAKLKKTHGSVDTSANVTTYQTANTVNTKYTATRGFYQSWFYSNECALKPVSAQQREGYADQCIPEDSDFTPNNIGQISNSSDENPDSPHCVLGIDYLKQYPQDLMSHVLTSDERQSMLAKIQGLIDQYVKTDAWPNSQLGNTAFQNKIHDVAVARGINEAFIYSLWIEESHAGATGTRFPFGCADIPDFYDSLQCLVGVPYLKRSFSEFMCTYAQGHFPCDFAEAENPNPNFVRNLIFYYNLLTGFVPTQTGDDTCEPPQSQNPPNASGQLKIMEIGDSITRGQGEASYRSILADKMRPCKVTFVGTQSGTGGNPDDPLHHEGYDRITTQRMLDEKIDTILKNNVPDVVLIMLGVNDIIQPGATTEHSKANLEAIIQKIREKKSDALIVLSNIIPITSQCSGWQSAVGAFNSNIIDQINGVAHVNPIPGFTENDYLTGDCVHPNNDGNAIIANAFASALKNIPALATCIQ